jgi:hypothetical protein
MGWGDTEENMRAGREGNNKRLEKKEIK